MILSRYRDIELNDNRTKENFEYHYMTILTV